MKSDSIVLEKSFNFSLEIIKLYQTLQAHKEYVISKQLLRSVTSVGANINEATAAISKPDFIHKMSLASKEARETRYWLMLLSKSELVKADYSEYLEKVDELIRMLTAIVKTSQIKGRQLPT
jgi:four helix bundle protein